MKKVLVLSLFLMSCATTNNVYRCDNASIVKVQMETQELRHHKKELMDLHKKIRVAMLQDTLIYFFIKNCITEEEKAICLEAAKEEAMWTPNDSLLLLSMLNGLISNTWIHCPNQEIGPIILEIKVTILKYTKAVEDGNLSFVALSILAAIANEDIEKGLIKVYAKLKNHVDSRYKYHCRRK